MNLDVLPNFQKRVFGVLASVVFLLLIFSFKNPNNTLTNERFDFFGKNKMDTLWVTQPSERLHLDIFQSQQKVTICNLQLQADYHILVSTSNKNLPLGKTSNCEMFVGKHNIAFLKNEMSLTPTQPCQTIFIQNPCEGKIQEAILTITNRDAAASVFSNLPAGQIGNKNTPEANIETDYNYSVEELIEEVFIGGGCFDVSNIQLIGGAQGVGHFSSGMTSIGIDEGVILSSGFISDAPGPNINGGTTGVNGGGTDPDLSQLAGGIVNDAAGIEFDFQPTLDSISFNFVFGSEEYCEYVNQFNDVFGFFISGPGINGPFTNNAVNIATVPGSGNPITINSINHLVNTNYFIPNDQNCGGVTNATEIEYDGYTVVMTAVANNLIPCETYHIRLVVADQTDTAFDTAVFLEANSFAAGIQAGVVSEVPVTGSSLAYEGCGDAFFTFSRDDDDLSMPLTLDFNISPNSTATNGVDYSFLPSTVTIPAGQSEVVVPISIFTDNISEGIETIIIEIDNTCSCSSSTAVVEISDVPPLQLELDDQMICIGQVVPIAPSISGGAEPLTYLWSSGETTPFISPLVQSTTTYTITVTDLCGNTATESATIDVVGVPQATISGFVEVCPPANAAGFLTIDFTGDGPWELFYTIDGVLQPVLANITSTPYILPVAQIGNYEIILLNSQGCPGVGAGIGVVTETIISPLTLPFDVSCNGLNDGHIDLIPVGGASPYTFQWSNGTAQQNPTNLPAGTYTATVTDINGCTGTVEAMITEPPPMTAAAIELSSVNCYGPMSGSIDLTVTGGSAPYTYNWDNGAPAVEDPTGLGPGNYNVTITADGGCTSTASVTITEDFTPPLVAVSAPAQLDCITTTTILDGTGSSVGNEFEYLWTTSGGNILSGETTLNPTVDGAGTYTLVITNTQNGCTETTSVLVENIATEPIADAGAPQSLDCSNTTATLDGSGSSIGTNIIYAWTTTNGNILSGESTLMPQVNGGGTYTLLVTDISNGCTATAEVLVNQSTDLPTAIANASTALTCTQPSVALDGIGSSMGNEFEYLWTTTNGNILSGETTLNPEVDVAGTYEILVTNTSNGCTATASVVLNQNGDLPTAEAGTANDLTCILSEITLDGSGSSAGGQFMYQWTTANGNILSGATTLNPVVNAMGTYQLLVTDQSNGCTAISTVFVNENIDEPTLNVATVPQINCDFPEIIIDASGSSAGSEFSYQWNTTTGNILSGENTLMPTVNLSGIYNLLITNDLNGCTAAIPVEVEGDTDQPIANAGVADPITCTQTSVSLNGNGSSAGIEFFYEWTTQNGNIVMGENTLTPLINAGGIYQLLVTDQTNGCTAISTVEVFVNGDLPTADAGPEGLLNCEITSAILNGNNSSAGAEITYLWTTPNGNILSGETTLNPEINVAGTYELLVSNTDNGCTATSTVEVLLDDVSPTADAGLAQTLSCTVSSLTLDGSNSSVGNEYTYLWTTTNGNIVSGETTLAPQVNATGSYELVVTSSNNGCTASAIVEVQQDASLPTADAGPAFEINCNVTSGFLDGTNSTITPEITFEWTTADGNILANANTLTPEVNASGIYQLTLTNTTNGCTAISTVTIPENTTPPVVDAGAALELNCNNTVINLDGTASDTGSVFTYLWTTATGNILLGENTLTPSVDAAGSYELLISNNQTGCTSTAQVVVGADFEAPTAAAGPADELNCTVLSTTLNGNASSTGNNFEYAWTTLTGNIILGENTLNPEVNMPGVYTLLVTNLENGCTASDAVNISQNTTLPNANAGTANDLTCTTTTITLDGGGSSIGTDITYLWTTMNGNILSGNNTINPVIDAPGTYTLQVTDASNNCTTTSEVTVNQDITNPISDAGVPATLTCVVTEAQLDGSNSSTGNNFSYLWTTTNGNILSGETSLFPQVNATGNYELLVTNLTTGCTSSSSVNVLLDGNTPNALAAPDDVLTCTNTTVSLNGNGSSVGNEFTYFWTTTNGNILSGETTLAPQVNQVGTYILEVTNTSNGCTNTTSVEVIEDVESPTALVDLTANLVLDCATSSIVLDGSSSLPFGNVSYQWTTTNGNITSGANTPNPEIDDEGIYTLVVTNLTNGCTDATTVNVTQDVSVPVVNIAMPEILTCDLVEISLNANNSSTGTNYTYQWTTANGNILSGGTTLTPLINQSGTYTLTIIDQTSNCENDATITVLENTTPPIADAGNADLLDCMTTSVILNGNNSSTGNGITYEWSTISGNIVGDANTIMITANAPGVYTLLVEDSENGCVASDNVVVQEDPNAPSGIIFTQTPPECAGDPGDIIIETVEGGTPPYLYSINGVDFYSGHIFTLEAGDYTLIAQDATGCETTVDFNIPELEAVEIGLTNSANIEMGDNYQINVTTNIPTAEIASVTWTPAAHLSCTDCLNPIAEALFDPITYTVLITNIYGCETTASITIEVDKSRGVYIPNVFTPNGDGVNDVFMIYAGGNARKIKNIKTFLVYDRWGEVVHKGNNFQPDDPDYGWAGVFKAQRLNPAVFVYWAEVEFIDGEIVIFKGDVALRR